MTLLAGRGHQRNQEGGDEREGQGDGEGSHKVDAQFGERALDEKERAQSMQLRRNGENAWVANLASRTKKRNGQHEQGGADPVDGQHGERGHPKQHIIAPMTPGAIKPGE